MRIFTIALFLISSSCATLKPFNPLATYEEVPKMHWVDPNGRPDSRHTLDQYACLGYGRSHSPESQYFNACMTEKGYVYERL